MSNLHTHADVSLFQFSAPPRALHLWLSHLLMVILCRCWVVLLPKVLKVGHIPVFLDSITPLYSALRLHGIRSEGLSVVECQEALICHFVSGNCFSNSYRVTSKRRKRWVTSTCSNIASGFASQEELSSAVLHMIVSSSEISTADLQRITHGLGIVSSNSRANLVANLETYARCVTSSDAATAARLPIWKFSKDGSADYRFQMYPTRRTTPLTNRSCRRSWQRRELLHNASNEFRRHPVLV